MHMHNSTAEMTLPVVFHPDYDIRVPCPFRWLHPFDVAKWGKVARMVTAETGLGLVQPAGPVSDQDLALVHGPAFLRNWHRRANVVRTSEVCLFALAPSACLHSRVLHPVRCQTQGTLTAVSLALAQRAATVNLGGGFHHCSADRSAGFCFLADITLAIRWAWRLRAGLSPVLVVDCDAHQGNGYARDVLRMSPKERAQVYIMDMFNASIYPRDELAKRAINREIHVTGNTTDHEYLQLLEHHLEATVHADRFRPELIIYNAGTDVLQGDRLGRLRISPQCVLQRDQAVMEFAGRLACPAVMLLSGGYQSNNARVIADSIENLLARQLIRPLP